MEAILPIHILAGTVSVLAGASALLFRKGARRHRGAGSVFVPTMIVMAITAMVLGGDMGNAVAGGLTIYMVITGWMAARRRDNEVGRFELLTFALAVIFALFGFYAAFQIASGASEAENPFIVGATIMVSTGMALAALGDISVVLRRGVSGAQRIARHLWRMCFGLFLAVGSFAAQGLEALPASIPRGEILLAAMAGILFIMFFWLVRVLFIDRRWRVEGAV